MSNNEEEYIAVSPDMVVLRVNDHCYCIEKGTIRFYCIDPKFENRTTKNLGQ